jgi:hypothetical protein
MAFERADSKTPASLPVIEVTLRDSKEGTEVVQEIGFDVTIRYSDGSAHRRGGNLKPHLTENQITQLSTFMTLVRTRAEAEIL